MFWTMAAEKLGKMLEMAPVMSCQFGITYVMTVFFYEAAWRAIHSPPPATNFFVHALWPKKAEL